MPNGRHGARQPNAQHRGLIMRSRRQNIYNEVIGIDTDGHIYLLNYTFEDTLFGEVFCGATGSIFVPLTQAEVDARNDVDNIAENYEHLWKEAVAEGETTDGLNDYVQNLIEQELSCGEGLFLGHDTSDTHYISDSVAADLQGRLGYEDEIIGYECIGGGRCFDREIQWKYVFRPDLLAEIERVEGLNCIGVKHDN